MSNKELIWMLRNNCGVSEAAVNAAHQAADRIEELEAKLAKAVEEAEKYQHAFAAQSRKLQAVLHIEGVRTTLAELKGEDRG